MCRCIVSRYNYARMSAVRASRIVRTRYFNENWLRLAYCRRFGRSSWLSNRAVCARGVQKYRGESRGAGRPPRRSALARLFSSWKIVKDRAAVSPYVVEETGNTSDGFQGLRLSPRLVAARSKDLIARFVRAGSISAAGFHRRNYKPLRGSLENRSGVPDRVIIENSRA